MQTESQLANLKPFQSGAEWKGNPGGRPKKKPLSEALERIVDKPANADKAAKALFARACRGKVVVPAFKELADRVEGKVVETVQVSGAIAYVSAVPMPFCEEAKQVVEVQQNQLAAGETPLEDPQQT